MDSSSALTSRSIDFTATKAALSDTRCNANPKRKASVSVPVPGAAVSSEDTPPRAEVSAPLPTSINQSPKKCQVHQVQLPEFLQVTEVQLPVPVGTNEAEVQEIPPADVQPQAPSPDKLPESRWCSHTTRYWLQRLEAVQTEEATLMKSIERCRQVSMYGTGVAFSELLENTLQYDTAAFDGGNAAGGLKNSNRASATGDGGLNNHTQTQDSAAEKGIFRESPKETSRVLEPVFWTPGFVGAGVGLRGKPSAPLSTYVTDCEGALAEQRHINTVSRFGRCAGSTVRDPRDDNLVLSRLYAVQRNRGQFLDRAVRAGDVITHLEGVPVGAWCGVECPIAKEEPSSSSRTCGRAEEDKNRRLNTSDGQGEPLLRLTIVGKRSAKLFSVEKGKKPEYRWVRFDVMLAVGIDAPREGLSELFHGRTTFVEWLEVSALQRRDQPQSPPASYEQASSSPSSSKKHFHATPPLSNESLRSAGSVLFASSSPAEERAARMRHRFVWKPVDEDELFTKSAGGPEEARQVGLRLDVLPEWIDRVWNRRVVEIYDALVLRNLRRFLRTATQESFGKAGAGERGTASSIVPIASPVVSDQLLPVLHDGHLVALMRDVYRRYARRGGPGARGAEEKQEPEGASKSRSIEKQEPEAEKSHLSHSVEVEDDDKKTGTSSLSSGGHQAADSGPLLSRGASSSSAISDNQATLLASSAYGYATIANHSASTLEGQHSPDKAAGRQKTIWKF
ncbi:unnamed protein product [Amoebophrya sp. A25]|nr:unnamed protein product [Amoebophrya sp. A25]|eukprot:GSA25T00024130001.1